MVGEQRAQHVLAVDPDRAHPGQVVEADLVDLDARRRDVEQLGHEALERDRDVAQPDRPVAGVEQGARHDADRVREVDDPRVRRRTLHDLLGDLEHDRHRAQRLREPAGARRLLTDAAARQRQRLVAQPRLLPADADLDQHEVGAVERALELAGDLEPAGEAGAVEHPARERADDLAALVGDVVQRELLDVERGEPGHELGRVRRPGADDGELHSFTPVSVTPSTNAFWARKKSRTTGASTITVAAMLRFHWTWCSVRNCASPTDSVQLLSSSPA